MLNCNTMELELQGWMLQKWTIMEIKVCYVLERLILLTMRISTVSNLFLKVHWSVLQNSIGFKHYKLFHLVFFGISFFFLYNPQNALLSISQHFLVIQFVYFLITSHVSFMDKVPEMCNQKRLNQVLNLQKMRKTYHIFI